MLDTFDIERRQFIGLLDMDFEPGVFPSKWDLTHMPVTAQELPLTPQVGPVQSGFHPAGSIVVEQPVSQMVEYYDLLIDSAGWKWMGC